MSPSFLGSNYSKYEERILNLKISNQELAQATANPLVESLNNTNSQLVFSKPLYHTVYDPNKKVDVEKSHQIAEIFDKVNFIEAAMICEGDSFNYGRGIAEVSWDKDPETNWLAFTAVERRPTDSFLRPKDNSIKSTAQRYKGLYYKDGILNFDQTQVWNYNKNTKYNDIISLNPKQVFSLAQATARFPDGPGITELLQPFLDGCQFSFNLSYVVMSEQINPKEIIDKDSQGSSDNAIVQRMVSNNGVETSLIPADKEMQHPRFYDRKDIIEFFKFFENLMYRVVYPAAALGSGESGGLLDNSSNLAKESIFFSYIDFKRQKLCRELNIKGNLLLELNGFKRQGYSYQCIPAPVVPRNIEIEAKIVPAMAKMNYLTPTEVRSWINSCVVGVKLENDFDESKVGIQTQPKTLNPDLQNKIQQVVQGSTDLDSLWELASSQKI